MKMNLFIASSVIAFASAQSPSRHFVGLYDSPLGEQHIPYPVDQCINVAVGLTGATHGVYSCSDDGTSVSYTHYGVDASCTDAASATEGPLYTMEGLQPGDLFSFNCFGTDNFIELKSVINDATCCNGAPTLTKVATDACFADLSGQYVSTVCDETTAHQYSYADSTCDPAGVSADPSVELFTDQCIIFDTTFFLININTVLNRCVVDGAALSEPDFCGTKTDDSTAINATAIFQPVASITPPETSTLPPLTTSRPLLSTELPVRATRDDIQTTQQAVAPLTSTLSRLSETTQP
eukprot:300799_1